MCPQTTQNSQTLPWSFNFWGFTKEMTRLRPTYTHQGLNYAVVYNCEIEKELKFQQWLISRISCVSNAGINDKQVYNDKINMMCKKNKKTAMKENMQKETTLVKIHV